MNRLIRTSPLPALGTLAACLVSSALIAQGAGPDEVGLPEIRSAPAETMVAAYNDSSWEAPRTSWGHPSFEGEWSTDDMRGIPRDRPEEFGARESVTQEEFLERAGRDEGGRYRAINTETFLRRETGIRTFGYTSLLVDPPTGRMPEMTEAGKARAAGRDRGTFGAGPFDDFDDFTLYDRCITRGIVGSALPVIYGNGIRIAQTPNEIAISYEMIHDTRIIPLYDRPFVDEEIRSYLGNSRGRWDGDTLVIETRNLTDQTSIGPNGNGTRHSDQMTLTERLTRVDPDMIEYFVTVNDPVAYTAPFTLRMMITRQPGYRLYEYSCHEGNGAVGHSLSGERAFERQVAEAIANGLPVPSRDGNGSIYGAPEEGAEIIDINAGQ